LCSINIFEDLLIVLEILFLYSFEGSHLILLFAYVFPSGFELHVVILNDLDWNINPSKKFSTPGAILSTAASLVIF
jgi:hypothetical protein